MGKEAQDAAVWRQALDLFERLDALTSEERLARIREVEETDAQLAQCLRQLCEADEDDGSTLERPLVVDAPGRPAARPLEDGAASDHQAALAVGAALGPYRLLHRIGEGGMGEVWEAEQREPVRRRVAIKVIREGLGSEEIVERFHNERQAMALMSHPNIAAVFDAAATEDGRPYFVMERVHGEPITSFCDQRHLDLPSRLELFQQVCAAVQHAHHKGLVHRDLKASNILVVAGDDTEGSESPAKPRPKVIDFGIAKAFAGPMAELASRTEHGRLVGTPEAMSPEQAEGRDVDTRSDVYSLGVLLYELLCGEKPLELEQLPVLEGLALISESEPVAPSLKLAGSARAEAIAAKRRSDISTLERMLRGDLDWIVLRSLAKERERRYATPAALASDLARHLADEPVVAGPPSTLYRLRKFVRRHRLSVGAAAAVLIALIAGLVVAAAGWSRAEREAEAARQAAELLADSFAVFDPNSPQGRMAGPVADDVLASGVQRTRDALVEQPRLQAHLMATLGRVYRNRGDFAAAKPLLEEALELRRSEYGDSHPEVARSHRELGWFAFAEGDRRGGLEHFEEAVAASEASEAFSASERISYLADLSLVLWKLGRAREARPHIKRAVALAEALGTKNGAGEEFQVLVARSSSHYVHGLVSTALGEWTHAESSLERSFALRSAAVGEDHPLVGWVLVDLGWLDRLRGRAPSAVERLRQAVAIFEERMGPDHPDTAVALNALGYALLDLGDLERSRATFARALAIRQSLFDPKHPDISGSLEGLAWVDLTAGDLASLRGRVTALLSARRAALGEHHPEVGYLLDLLAHEAWARGESERARDFADQCLAQLRASLGPDHPRLASITANLGGAAYRAGDLPAARRLASTAFDMAGRERDTALWVGRVSALELSRIASLEGRLDQALEYLEEAVARGYDRSLLTQDPDLRSLREDPDQMERFRELAGDQNR